VSAINFVDGGPMSVLTDCLLYLSTHLSNDYQIIALVHKKQLFDVDHIEYYEFPRSTKSWFFRIYYEYVYFKKLSEKLKPYLWLSFHDMTPNIKSEIQAVYCHNSSPFYNCSFKDVFLNFNFFLFTLFYKYLYRINIKSNDYVIVQQNWLRNGFYSMFKHPNIIVSHPVVEVETIKKKERIKKKVVNFLYPTFPRVFKGVETICEAVKIMEDRDVCDFHVTITIDGSENKYSKMICNKYRQIKSISFIGLQSRQKIYSLYEKSDCMIFASKLESWGMPLTEYMAFNKPIIVRNKPYAYETIGDYDKAVYFKDVSELVKVMQAYLNDTIVYKKMKKVEMKEPFARGWNELFDILLMRK
jgi:glycosyltransferase involved in cell wall biosynthesis